MTSADRRLAAISKVVRVRVEFSKKTLKTLLPRSSGTFFTSRSVTPAKGSAVSRICVRISRGRPSMESRCWSSPWALSCGLTATFDLQRKPAVGGALEPQPRALGHVELRAGMLRLDRQLPPAAVGEHDERDRARPAVIEELVHRRAHGTPRVEHVVHEQQVPALDIERNFRALGVVLEALLRVIVAVERDVHEAERLLQP